MTNKMANVVLLILAAWALTRATNVRSNEALIPASDVIHMVQLSGDMTRKEAKCFVEAYIKDDALGVLTLLDNIEAVFSNITGEMPCSEPSES